MTINRYISGRSSKGVMGEMQSRFTGYRPSPSRTRQEDMYAEGQRRAVEWISQNQPPHFNDAFLEKASYALKSRTIDPTTHMDDIMLDAGKQEVLSFLRSRTTNSEVIGDPSKLRSYITAAAKWGRSLLGKIFG